MKKQLLILLLLLAIKGYCQTPPKGGMKLDEKTIVKDSTGTALPMATWQKLLQSGDYSMKPGAQGEFTIFKLTEAQKARLAEMRKTNGMASGSLKVGEKFKGEKMTDIKGNTYDLTTASDKIYVINFWFVNCAPCKQEIPELNEVVKKYKGNKEVVFLAIALDDKSSLNSFLKATPFDYHIISDGKSLASKYGVTGFPTHVIVGKDGLIKFTTRGYGENTVDSIKQNIATQLKGG